MTNRIKNGHSGEVITHRRWLTDAGLLPEGLAEASDETAEVTP